MLIVRSIRDRADAARRAEPSTAVLDFPFERLFDRRRPAVDAEKRRI